MSRVPIVAGLVLALGCGAEATTEVEPTAPVYEVDPNTGVRIAALGPVPELPVWADNPSTPEKLVLGRILFNDPRLSGSGRVGCGACHFQTTWFQSNTPQDVPDRSYPDIAPRLTRNAPSLINLVYAPACRWDGGHCESLEEVLMLPFAEANMNLTDIPSDDVHTLDVETAKARFRQRVVEQMPGYVDVFMAAFGVDITDLDAEEIWLLGGRALAVLMREAVSVDAPFDKWNAGDDTAMTQAQVRGLEVFLGDGGCVVCHNGPFFSDFEFHNVSTSPPDETGARADEGRYLITGKEEDRGKFLTPTLRNAVMTAPWWHNGASVNLAEVIDQFAGPKGKADPNHDPILNTLEPLTDDQVDDLMQFMKALTGTHPAFEPFAIIPDELPNLDTVPLGFE